SYSSSYTPTISHIHLCFYHPSRAHLHLPSFPTRRSSDLSVHRPETAERQALARADGDLRLHRLEEFQLLHLAAESTRAVELRLVNRKSTRLNSSHRTISYAVFCLKKKKKKKLNIRYQRSK